MMWILRRVGLKFVLFITLVLLFWMLVCSLFMVAETYNHDPDTLHKQQYREVTRAVLVQSNTNVTLPSKYNHTTTTFKVHRKTGLPLLDMNPDDFIHAEGEDREESTLLYGTKRQKKGFMTIGIPTVSRRNGTAFYLTATLDSFINNTEKRDREEVLIVIFMADFNQTWNLHTAAALYAQYRPYCDSGFIQIIQSPMNIYPNFSHVKLTLKDPFQRVKWRSKQNIDFAFLMMYCEKLSQYYLQLEDDVISARGYVTDIRDFVKLQENPWACLEFSNLGFIGKLFHSHHIDVISSSLLKSFYLQPCDILLGKIVLSLGQKKAIHSNVSLFQHIGKASSLNNKLMPSIDQKFKHIGDHVLIISSIPKGDNPAATFHTNMLALNKTLPQNPYSEGADFIVKAPIRRSFYKVVFKKPYNVSQIIISTGDNKYKNNILRYGELYLRDQGESCDGYKGVKTKFVDGEIDTTLQGVQIPPNLNCILISTTRTQKEVLIIRAISVIVRKS